MYYIIEKGGRGMYRWRLVLPDGRKITWIRGFAEEYECLADIPDGPEPVYSTTGNRVR